MRALALVAVVLAACAPGAAPQPGGTSSPAAAGATAPPAATWPLRGAAVTSGDESTRRPIVVRIGNEDAARPQAGLAKADLIVEVMVEGGITRLAVVFHSQDTERIGPVRSGRLSDLHYTPMLRGILVHVGAQATVLRRIRDAARGGAFIDVDQFEHGSAFDRIGERPAPQNVFTSTKRIRDAAQKAGDRGNVSVPSLEFASEPPAGGRAAASFVVPYAGSHRAAYEFAGGTYTRTQGGETTIDEATKAEVRPDNVVVIKTDFTEQRDIVEDELGSRSLEVRSTGTGPVVVLRDGQRFDGTWTRQGTDMYRFADQGGKPIALKPGLTWMHVVPLSFELGG